MHVNLRYQVRLNIFMLLITIYMIHIYFIYIFKCNLVYIVLLMCKVTHVPDELLLQMFITCLMYMGVTIIKIKRDVEKKV